MKRLLRSDGFDVIVVGSGLAGLSAALTVAEFGYSPVILEKTCEPGGLTRRAYGFFNAADARRQIALGIDDSPEKHLRQALEVSRGKAREPLMRTLCYEAYSTLQWLEALGLEFEPGIRRVLGGVYPRTHMPLRGAGEAYLSALRSALRPFGVPIVCNAEVTALRKSGDAVTGVEGLLSGEPFRLTSRLGVVLAGGGFSRNMEMMRLYAPGLSDVLPALDEGADGSLIQAAADIGARRSWACPISRSDSLRPRSVFQGIRPTTSLVNARANASCARTVADPRSPRPSSDSRTAWPGW